MEMHPEWEYHLWREEDIAGLSLRGRRAFGFYVGRGLWHGAANVARVEILAQRGGVYVDIDSRPLRPFDAAPFMEASFFAGYEPNIPSLPGRIANGTIGAEAAHPVLNTYISIIRALKRLEPSWDTTGGTGLTAAILLHRRCCSPVVLPARVLYPRDAYGNLTPGNEEPYCDHFWATTNGTYR